MSYIVIEARKTLECRRLPRRRLMAILLAAMLYPLILVVARCRPRLMRHATRYATAAASAMPPPSGAYQGHVAIFTSAHAAG